MAAMKLKDACFPGLQGCLAAPPGRNPAQQFYCSLFPKPQGDPLTSDMLESFPISARRQGKEQMSVLPWVMKKSVLSLCCSNCLSLDALSPWHAVTGRDTHVHIQSPRVDGTGGLSCQDFPQLFWWIPVWNLWFWDFTEITELVDDPGSKLGPQGQVPSGGPNPRVQGGLVTSQGVLKAYRREILTENLSYKRWI